MYSDLNKIVKDLSYLFMTSTATEVNFNETFKQTFKYNINVDQGDKENAECVKAHKLVEWLTQYRE